MISTGKILIVDDDPTFLETYNDFLGAEGYVVETATSAGEARERVTHGEHAVVLIFYPGDMTPGCTMQLCSIRDEWKSFTDAGIRVLGVNPSSAASHERFKTVFHLPFPLLIDTDKKVSEAYDALFSFFGIRITRRTVVGIDKTGTVRYIKRGMPKTQDILKAMQKYH